MKSRLPQSMGRNHSSSRIGSLHGCVCVCLQLYTAVCVQVCVCVSSSCTDSSPAVAAFPCADVRALLQSEQGFQQKPETTLLHSTFLPPSVCVCVHMYACAYVHAYLYLNDNRGIDPETCFKCYDSFSHPTITLFLTVSLSLIYVLSTKAL